MLYGWFLYLIAVDRAEIIWAYLAVVGVALLTGSAAATGISAVVAVTALSIQYWSTYGPRKVHPRDEGRAIRPQYAAAAWCAIVAVAFAALGLFKFALGFWLFVLIAYVAIEVSRPRRGS